jgi:hypothetical protein
MMRASSRTDSIGRSCRKQLLKKRDMAAATAEQPNASELFTQWGCISRAAGRPRVDSLAGTFKEAKRSPQETAHDSPCH